MRNETKTYTKLYFKDSELELVKRALRVLRSNRNLAASHDPKLVAEIRELEYLISETGSIVPQDADEVTG